MAENDPDFKENVKNSFLKVKEDMDQLKVDNTSNKREIDEIKSKMNVINENISKIALLFKNKLENSETTLKSSIGNKGVVNDQQQSTTINNDQRSSTMPNNQQQSTTSPQPATLIRGEKNSPSLLNQELIKKIKSLTDREFSIFIKIYELNATKDEITFADLANILKLTEGTIRGSVTRILAKGLPLVKERFFNKKSSLFIETDSFNSSILPEIIKARAMSIQKTLNDHDFN